MTIFKWFSDVTTAEECKKRYYSLCKDYHPDNGGNEDVFKEIQNEFSSAWEYYKNKHFKQDKGVYTEDEKTDTVDSEFLKTVLSKLSTIPMIEIEICGSWIWVGGNTFPYRTEFSKWGFNWSKSKKKWYYAEGLPKKRYRGRKTMNQIRLEYGSKMYKSSGLFLENA